MSVLIVVPTRELKRPGTSGIKVSEALGEELGALLGGTEQRLRVGVVIAHAGPRVRRLHSQPVQHRQHRGGLQREAGIAVQHGFGQHGGDTHGQRGAAHQVRSVHGVVRGVHLPADDLATVQILDQVQVVLTPTEN